MKGWALVCEIFVQVVHAYLLPFCMYFGISCTMNAIHGKIVVCPMYYSWLYITIIHLGY